MAAKTAAAAATAVATAHAAVAETVVDGWLAGCVRLAANKQRSDNCLGVLGRVPFYQPSHAGLAAFPDYGEASQDYILDGQGLCVGRAPQPGGF